MVASPLGKSNLGLHILVSDPDAGEIRIDGTLLHGDPSHWPTFLLTFCDPFSDAYLSLATPNPSPTYEDV